MKRIACLVDLNLLCVDQKKPNYNPLIPTLKIQKKGFSLLSDHIKVQFSISKANCIKSDTVDKYWFNTDGRSKEIYQPCPPNSILRRTLGGQFL